MYKNMLFVLCGFYSVSFAMDDLPACIDNMHVKRDTRLVGSATERDDEDDAFDVVVDLHGALACSADDPHDAIASALRREHGSCSGTATTTPDRRAKLAYTDLEIYTGGAHSSRHTSRTSSLRVSSDAAQTMAEQEVDLSDDLRMSEDQSLTREQLIQQILVQLPKPVSSISADERRKNVEDLLVRLEAQKPAEYKHLTCGLQEEVMRRRRITRFTAPNVQFGVNISDIYGFTETIVAKVLGDENQILNNKVLTEQEKTKAAEKTEFRVKVISGVATGIVFTAFIVAQSLSSALS